MIDRRLRYAAPALLDTVCSMSSDESQKAADDSLKAYERKLPAESAVTTEHTVEIKGNLVPYLLRPTLLSACSRSSYRQSFCSREALFEAGTKPSLALSRCGMRTAR